MARLVNQLTEAKIRSLDMSGLHADGAGLYLQIRDGRARSWIFRFTLNGRTRDMGLGPLSQFGLTAVRGKAAECRTLVAKGIDPIEHTKVTPAANSRRASPGPTFRESAEAYMDTKLKKLRSEVHRQQWRYSFEKFAYPIIGDLSVGDVGTQEVLAVLRPIWEDRCETAARLRGRIERVIARATVEGHRKGDNPARWQGHLQEALPSRSEVRPIVHHRAMEIAEIPTFMAKLTMRPEVGAAALSFLILTASRTGETIGATWPEIDRSEGLWTIPPARAKTNRAHVVPLSSGALAALRQMQPLRDVGDGFIFPGRNGQGLSQMALLALLQRRMGHAATVHGFRSTFRDWCGDVAAIPEDLAEAALAHVSGDRTERAYRRRTAIERRREVMQRWCDYCLPPQSDAASVVDMQQKRERSTEAA